MVRPFRQTDDLVFEIVADVRYHGVVSLDSNAVRMMTNLKHVIVEMMCSNVILAPLVRDSFHKPQVTRTNFLCQIRIHDVFWLVSRYKAQHPVAALEDRQPEY